MTEEEIILILKQDLRECIDNGIKALQEIRKCEDYGAVCHWRDRYIEEQNIKSGLYDLINSLEDTSLRRAKMMDDGTLCCRCGCEIYLEACGYSRLCTKCNEEVSK